MLSFVCSSPLCSSLVLPFFNSNRLFLCASLHPHQYKTVNQSNARPSPTCSAPTPTPTPAPPSAPLDSSTATPSSSKLWDVTSSSPRPTIFLIDIETLIHHAEQTFSSSSNPMTNNNNNKNTNNTNNTNTTKTTFSTKVLNAFIITLTTVLKRHVCGRPVLLIFPSYIPRTNIIYSICHSLGLSIVYNENNDQSVIPSILDISKKSNVRSILITANTFTPYFSLLNIPWFSILVILRPGVFEMITTKNLLPVIFHHNKNEHINFKLFCTKYFLDILTLSSILPIHLSLKLILSFRSLHSLLHHCQHNKSSHTSSSSSPSYLTSNIINKIAKSSKLIQNKHSFYLNYCFHITDLSHSPINWNSIQRKSIDKQSILNICQSINKKISNDSLSDRMLHSADDVPHLNGPTVNSKEHDQTDDKQKNYRNQGNNHSNISNSTELNLTPSNQVIDIFVSSIVEKVSIIPIYNSNHRQKSNILPLDGFILCKYNLEIIFIPLKKNCKPTKSVIQLLSNEKIEKHGWFIKDIIKSLILYHNIKFIHLFNGFKTCFDIPIACHILNAGYFDNTNNNSDNKNIESFISSKYLSNSEKQLFHQFLNSITSPSSSQSQSTNTNTLLLPHFENKNDSSLNNLITFSKLTCSISDNLKNDIIKYDLHRVIYDIESPLISIMADMEMNGLPINIKSLKALHDKLRKQRIYLRYKLQLLLNVKKSKSRSSLGNKEIMKFLGLTADNNKIKQQLNKRVLFLIIHDKTNKYDEKQKQLSRFLLKYREVSNLLQISTMPLLKYIHLKTNRIYTNYNQISSSSGRISTSKPNLQCLPSKSILKGQFRSLISTKTTISNKDKLILIADYSQIELRILASLSNDSQLLKVFNNLNTDVHYYIATLFFHQKLISDSQRSIAKQILYSIIYGISSSSLYSSCLSLLNNNNKNSNNNNHHNNTTKKDIDLLIFQFYKQFPSLKPFISQLIQNVQSLHFAETLSGRKQFISSASSISTRSQRWKRLAVNMPIQGTQADMIKLAMIKIYKQLIQLNLYPQNRFILQLHDELVMEIHKDHKSQVINIVKNEMINALPLPNVQIAVKVGVGNTWLDAMNSTKLYGG